MAGASHPRDHSLAARPVGASLLREALRQDDPLRELSVARFALWAAAACIVAVGLLVRPLGLPLSIALWAMLGTLFVYYLLQLRALRRGWFHPLLQWANTAVEVSTPSLIFVLDVLLQGPEFALSAPPLVFWGPLIALSALRSRRSIAIFAGVVAAVEYLALYFALALPRLPPEPLATFSPPFIVFRAFFLVCAGGVAAALAGHLLRKAEASLRAVRERDWMGKYFLHERIGVGGMAEVFRATYSPEGGFEKEVAIKRVLPAFAGDPEFVRLFRREAEVCSRLHHPNVVQVYDLGRHAGTYFLAMELVQGVSLDRVLRAQPGAGLTVPAAVFVAAEVAAALDYVHSLRDAGGLPLGLVHRDVNPPNVLIAHSGEVKLTDFGVARAVKDVTRADWMRGKVRYMAPEQIAGDAPLDARTDLFALGLTLHELLTGRPVITGETELDQIRAAVTETFLPPSAVRPEVPAELDAIVMALLERDPASRPRSGDEVRARLVKLIDPASARAELAAAAGAAMAAASTTAADPDERLAG